MTAAEFGALRRVLAYRRSLLAIEASEHFSHEARFDARLKGDGVLTAVVLATGVKWR